MGTGSVKGLILLPTLREQSRGPWVKQVDPSGSWLKLSACLAAAPRCILDPYSPKIAVQCVTVDTCMQIHTAGWDSPVPLVKAFVPSPSETLLHNSVISLARHVWHDPHWCLHIDTLTPAVITVPQTWGSHPLSDLSHCIQTAYVHTHMSTHVHTQAREPSVIEWGTTLACCQARLYWPTAEHGWQVYSRADYLPATSSFYPLIPHFVIPDLLQTT